MTAGSEQPLPGDADAARRHLDEGNRRFADVALSGAETSKAEMPTTAASAADSGMIGDAQPIPIQRPFAAVLGCADARIPVELVFGTGVNELFVTRVAGNTPCDEVVGSFQYAALNLKSLRLVVVLGHTACGAVSAAVDAHLKGPATDSGGIPDSLAGLVCRIVPAVEIAAAGLSEAHGKDVTAHTSYADVLLATAVVINAAWTAHRLERELAALSETPLPVAFGIFDIARRRVGVPAGGEAFRYGLHDPPDGTAGLGRLATELAGSPSISRTLQSDR